MSATTLRIERATNADVPGMVELLRDLFTIERGFAVNPAKQETALRWLVSEMGRTRVLVAHDPDGSVIGMVTAQLVISTAEGALSAWIEDMVVRQDRRRQGVGSALLDAILQWTKCNGVTRAQLVVDSGNAASLAYYQRLNWEPTDLIVRRKRL